MKFISPTIVEKRKVRQEFKDHCNIKEGGKSESHL